MFTLPLYSLLILFGLFLLVFFTFLYINIRDLIQDRAINVITFTATATVMVLTLATLLFSSQLLRDISWTQSIVVFENGWFDSTNAPGF